MVIDVVQTLLWVLGGLTVGIAISITITAATRVLRRRYSGLKLLRRRLRQPQRILLAVLGASTGLLIGTSGRVLGGQWAGRGNLEQGVRIAIIFAVANLMTGVLRALGDRVNERHSFGDPGDAQRARTQMQLVVRVGVVVVWLVAVAIVLLTFESFRAIGASIFASAGILSIVAGLAAQSSLANLFAGLQIAFSDALRVGDSVAVEGITGTVEEITLSNIVVRVWDGRRLVIPSTKLTSESFENWTKTDPSQLGDIYFDLDWMVPVSAFRAEALRLVEQHEKWDMKTATVQVTDTQGGHVTVRVLVSAANSDELWGLRTSVRESLVSWLQTEAPYALPRTRLEPETTSAPPKEARDELVAKTQEELAKVTAENQDRTVVFENVPDPDETTESLFAWWHRRREESGG